MALHVLDFFHHTPLEFVSKTLEKDDIYTFSFKPTKAMQHIAGQHSLFVFSKQLTARPFSLASSPDEEFVKIGTHTASGSRFKKQLMKLVPGDTIQMFGPYLNFIPPNDSLPIIMLAQGIGITPFRSLLLWLAAHEPNRATHLIHVESANHTYRAETEKAATSARFVVNPEAFSNEIREATAQHPDAWYYISGSPRFVRSISEQLKSAGIPAKQIKKDGFLGY